ncbi:MAG: TonB-dependent receptor, partial [Draconibacterium sp.]|nr:TonB-dependent receptor [Draconibacterium sp.]
INIVMEVNSIGLEEVIAVGYGTQRKGELTVSVSQVKGEQLESIPKANIMEALGGRAAGVSVVSSSGAPGAGSSLRIRGANSINSSAEPLYVIDGFPVAATSGDLFEGSRLGFNGDKTSLLSMINPNDIESIEFLKDAAATSIYGSRGANGVVIITTKTGKQGRSDITVSVNLGVQKMAKQWDMMNGEQFSTMLYDAYETGGIDMANLAFNPGQRLAVPIDYNTNWVDEVVRMGKSQDYNVSFSGASKKTKYSGSVGYYNNEGIIRNNSYERLTARLNGETKGLDGKLTAGLNMNLSYVDQKTINNRTVYQAALQDAPVYPVYYPEGTLYAGYLTHNSSGSNVYNVLWGDSYGVAASNAMTMKSPLFQTDVAMNPQNTARIITNAFLSLEIIDGLVLKTSAGADLNYSKMKYLAQKKGPYMPTGGSLEHKQSQTYTWLLENTLTYTKKFNKHSLTALVGQSAQEYKMEGLGIAMEEADPGNNFVSNNPFFVDGWWFDNGKTDHLTDHHKYAKVADWTVASYFGRLNYSFDNKYMLTATVRRDGSSKFGKENKWGTFPGVSMAWNMQNEDFFNLPNVQQLKVRASYGVVGNGNIASYQSQALLTSKPAKPIGVVVAGTSTKEKGLADPALGWESTSSIDFGVDSRIYDRVSITSDIYWKKTSDLLFGFNLPQSTGFDKIATTNLGTIKQFGVELAVTGDIIQAKSDGGFNWEGTLILDHQHGKVTELPPNVDWVGGYIRSALNEPIGQIYGYQVEGIYNEQSELDDPGNPYSNAQLGDYKYKDIGSVDEFGNYILVPDNAITGADRTNLGNVNPKFSFGFNNSLTYGNFDVNVFFNGSVGNKIYNQTKRILLDASGERNLIQEAANRWTPSNHSQTIQAANSNRKSPVGGNPISIFVEDGSYLRLANLNFGYTLPNHILSSINIQSIRLYASINNVFVLTKYSGLDPEVGGGDALVSRGIDRSAYPKSRTISFGLNMKF